MSTNFYLIVGLGDLKVGKPPDILKANVGSCVALTIYDHTTKIGGLAHIMLPKKRGTTKKRAKYADVAIPTLINEIIFRGNAKKENLTAKVFGGAKILPLQSSNIGEENVKAVCNLLKKEKIKIIAKKTGGTKGYMIEFDTKTGYVSCHVFGEKTCIF